MPPAVRCLAANSTVSPLVSLVLSLALSLWAAAAAAQTAAELYEQGVTARGEQRFEDAVATLERSAALDPANADVQVQLGFARLALGKHEAASSAFERALDIAPDYQDANFGLAQIAFRSGSLGEARSRTETFLAQRPADVEAAALLARIERAEAAEAAEVAAATAPGSAHAPSLSASIQQRLAKPLPRNWRLDLGSEVSDLSGARSSWTDSAIGLAYRATGDATVSGRVRRATRFGLTDIQLEARLDYAHSRDLSFHGLLAATPESDFLAERSIGAGTSWRASERGTAGGPLFLSLDIRHDRYPDSDVTTLSPGLQYFLLDARLGISARWVGSQDDHGTSAAGYLLRGDVVATDRLRLIAGYADAPEISAGALVKVRTAFAGLSFDINDKVTVNVAYAHEVRDAFDRDTVGIGLSLRF